MDTVRFHDIYTAHAPDVQRFAHWLCGNRHDAEDLAAEAFVRAFAGADTIDARTVKGYLLAIVRNLHLEHLRRKKATVEIEVAHLVADECPGVAAETTETAQRLQRALALLPESERSALLLRVDGGLTYEEIAAVLGVTVANAKVRVHRARVRLANLLEEPS